MGLIKKDKNT